MRKLFALLTFAVLFSCSSEDSKQVKEDPIIYKYGFDQSKYVFDGKVSGRLQWPPRGAKGFGYDPIFVPEGHQMTFAEMDPEQKHCMSHRAKAVEKFKIWLERQ